MVVGACVRVHLMRSWALIVPKRPGVTKTTTTTIPPTFFLRQDAISDHIAEFIIYACSGSHMSQIFIGCFMSSLLFSFSSSSSSSSIYQYDSLASAYNSGVAGDGDGPIKLAFIRTVRLQA